ncbi:MAG: C45 family peptidase, partial [Chloroflexi bacterium]|nr:C45 family peptidase [Chloroflexota bacterium]
MARVLRRNAVLFAYHPADRAAFISISWPGLIGVTTAMNEAGLCLGNLTSYTRATTPNGVPTAILYRTIVEQATTLRSVGQLLRSTRRTIGNNLVVSSGPESRAVLFETTMDSVTEVAPEDGVLVATNHFVSPVLARRQRPYLLADSVRKWERLRDLCRQTRIGRDGALAILADVGGGNESRPLARIANEGTA